MTPILSIYLHMYTSIYLLIYPPPLPILIRSHPIPLSPLLSSPLLLQSYLSIRIYILSTYISYPHIYLSLYLLIYIPIYPHISLSTYLHIYLYIYLSIYIYLPIHLSIYVYNYLYNRYIFIQTQYDHVRIIYM